MRGQRRPAGKAEMCSCPGRWMGWQTAFQDPGGLAWSNFCIRLMAVWGAPVLAGQDLPALRAAGGREHFGIGAVNVLGIFLCFAVSPVGL